MITVYQREINGKKGEWTFHSIYADGTEGGEHREKEYASNFKEPDMHKEYKVKVDNE
jgi:hypothetical protein|tara:strand:- start:38 stop:208 length:171 start_codon:yes stop_codon:yes gene_type:complete